MRKRIVLIGLGLLGLAIGGAAWFAFSRQPLPPAIDYKAELIKLTLEGQSTDPNARNGWDALLAVGGDARAIVRSIEDREYATDETAKNAGQLVEEWSFHVLGSDLCVVPTPRDERLNAESWHQVEKDRIFERIAELRDFDVFVMNFDDRIAASVANGSAGADITNITNPVRYLGMVVLADLKRSIEEQDWKRALQRIDDSMFLGQTLMAQADTIVWLLGRAGMQQPLRILQQAVLGQGPMPEEFLIGARERLLSGARGQFDHVIRTERLVGKEMIEAYMKETASAGSSLFGPEMSTSQARSLVDEQYDHIKELKSMDLRQLRATIADWQEEAQGQTGMNAMALSSRTTIANLYVSVRHDEVETDVTRMLMAIAMYASRHGAPPESLDALVPDFLAELPKDPWAPDGKYRYTPGPTMKDIVLYTVAWDAVDDGGHYLPARPDRGLTPEGKGLDYVFTRDACKDRAESPEAWEQP